ncbi:hypothetical protein P7C71_g1977, partial [Lecanoromycetidae sp. Uapishka_2]
MYRSDSAESVHHPNDDIFAVGEHSEPPSPVSELGEEQEWESGIVQYQRQPGVKAPMSYPSIATSYSAADDGQVSPLEEEFDRVPIHQIRQATVVTNPLARHVSEQAVVLDFADTRNTLSDWSGSTEYVEDDEAAKSFTVGRRSSSSYRSMGSPYDSSPRNVKTAEPDPIHEKKSFDEDQFDDIDLFGTSEASKPDPGRFDAAYKMLTDSSKVEGGKAIKPVCRESDLWMT